MVTARGWFICGVLAAVVAVAAPISTAGAQPAAPGSGRAAGLDRIVNTVWIVVASPDVRPGALYVFLSTKVLAMSSEGSTPSFGTWGIDGDGLVMTEEGRAYKVDILELNADRFRIRINNPGRPTEITFAPAGPDTRRGDPGPGSITPIPTTYVCGGAAFKVAFEAGAACVTMPDGTVTTLGRLGGAEATDALRTYTNGRLTFVEDRKAGEPRVTLALGRMVPTPCTKAP